MTTEQNTQLLQQRTQHRKRSKHSNREGWKVSSLRASALSSIPPVFSDDHRFLAVLTSIEIRLYSFPSHHCIAAVPIADAANVVDLVLDSAAGPTSEGYPQLWLAMRSGEIQHVNWSEGANATTKVDLTVYGVERIHRIVDVLEDGKVFVLFVSSGARDQNISLVRVAVTEDEPSEESQPESLLEVRDVHLLTLSHARTHFIFQSSSRSRQSEELTVGKFADPDYKTSVISASIYRQRVSTTVAVSDSGIVALGGSSGVIDLYYPHVDPEASEEQLARTLTYKTSEAKNYLIRSFKWHLSPVRALSFSLDGNYLLSGGNEKVLLFWQLETSNIQFLPRLPGPITNIVVDKTSTTYAVSLGDNSDDIVVFAATDLDARLQVSSVKAVFPSLSPSSPAAALVSSSTEMTTSASLRLANQSKVVELTKAAINAIAKAGASAIPNYALYPSTIDTAASSSSTTTPSAPHNYWYFPTATNAQVQIYDAVKGEQVGTHVVARTLQTGKVLFEDAIADAQVSQLELSAGKDWMATVDETVTQPIDGLLSRSDLSVVLKFWSKRQSSSGNNEKVAWSLVTRVRSPMGENVPVAALAAAPATYHKGRAFVTACFGGGVKLWRPRFPKVKTRQVEWSTRQIMEPTYAAGVARSSLAYRAQEEKDYRDEVVLSWSADGSVLLMGIGSLIHVISVPATSRTSTRSGEEFKIVRTLSGIVEGPIRGLGMLGTSIVAFSPTRVTTFDILQDKIAWSTQVGYTPKHSKSLIAFGSSSTVSGSSVASTAAAPTFFAVAVNHVVTSRANHRARSIAANLYIFSTASSMPVHVLVHPKPIAAVHSLPGGVRQRFTFLDTDKMAFTVSAPDSVKIGGRHRPSAIIASAIDVQAGAESADEVEDETDGEAQERIGVTAILHPSNGKFTVPDSTANGNGETDPAAFRENVVLAPTIVDEVFTKPEYAMGDLDSVFNKLLTVIGREEK
ncbi:hypothetical protein BZA70DRAFT_278704 [Myxozyma melibiosi]|uniref:WD40 repeat-like protein n=1 Tax=Myxozyma melibiosi TaxID=54550 RepID=A0ABR1F785_9ASCO